MTINNIYIDFAKIVLSDDTYSRKCMIHNGDYFDEAMARRTEELENIIKEMNREFARNVKRTYRQ